MDTNTPSDRPAYTTTHKSLRKEVHQILGKKRSQVPADEIREAHGEFVTNYPKFYEKLMAPSVDMQQMEYILGMYEKVQKNKTTFESASKQIGQRMFDQYVKPDLPPPSDTPCPGVQFKQS